MEDDDDNFDPVIARGASGTGISILYNDKTIKTYKNVWTIIAIDTEDTSNRYILTTNERPTKESVNELVSEKTELDGYYWNSYLTAYYFAHVSMNFENLFISAMHRNMSFENFDWDEENSRIVTLNEPDFQGLDDQGFFGHGGWTSVIVLE